MSKEKLVKGTIHDTTVCFGKLNILTKRVTHFKNHAFLNLLFICLTFTGIKLMGDQFSEICNQIKGQQEQISRQMYYYFFFYCCYRFWFFSLKISENSVFYILHKLLVRSASFSFFLVQQFMIKFYGFLNIVKA